MRSTTRVMFGTVFGTCLAAEVRRFAADSSGVTAVEYVLLMTLIGLAIMVILAQISGSLNSAFESVDAFISR